MKGPRGNNREHNPGHGAGLKRSWRRSWLRAGIAMGLCLAATACGPLSHAPGASGSGGSGSGGSGAGSSAASPATGPAIAPLPATAVAAATATQGAVAPIEKIAPIPTAMETFKALTREDGVKLTPLFDKPAGGTDERLKRLETAVQNMRNDFDTIMPTMVRMVSMEQSLKELVGQLRTLTGENANEMVPDDQTGSQTGDIMGPVQPAAAGTAPPDAEKAASEEGPEKAGPPVDHTLPPAVAAAITPPEADSKPQSLMTGVGKTAEPENPAAAPPPAAAEPPAAAAATPVATGTGTLKAVRVADHGAQTRVVIDMSDKAALPVSIDKDGRQLVIDPAGMGWSGQAEQTLKNSKLVSGYKYENGRLVVDLRQRAKIVAHEMLAPGGGAGYRTVIDLAPAP